MWNGIHHVILNNQKLCALYINWNMFFKKGHIVSQMQCSIQPHRKDHSVVVPDDSFTQHT